MNVDAVVVTFNRLEKLKNTLASYEAQTKSFRNLIVVDNCSKDGTKEFLDVWKEETHPFAVHVLHLSSNMGGSGGFYAGEKYSMEHDPDWVLVSDDDAYPMPDVMEIFNQFIEQHQGGQISAVCGAVVGMDGVIDTGHRCHENWSGGWSHYMTPVPVDNYQKEQFDFDFLSYVGSFINAKAMKKVGLVNEHYFIYNDDTEHSIRLVKYGRLVCLPGMVFHHDNTYTKAKNDNDGLLTWRDYYSCRNELNMFLKHKPKKALLYVLFLLKTMKKYKKGEYTFLTQGRNAEEVKLLCQAYKDGFWGRLGVNKLYKHGFRIG